MYQLAWGTDGKLNDFEFYNRTEDLSFISDLITASKYGSSPTILLTGIRGVGKTALIKKLEEELKVDFFVTYIDLTESPEYQNDELNRIDVVKLIYNCIMKSCKSNNLQTTLKQIKKYIKTHDLHITNYTSIKDVPIPIIESEENYSKLMDYIMELPQKIYEENSDKYDATVIFIDEIQVLKDLNEDLTSFLWYLRSKIQFQKNVTYVFSGSMSTKDDLITQIAGQKNAFGGRILTIEINPFSYETTKKYLNDKMPNILLTSEAIKCFFECTHGIPYYINTFANLLPQNILLDKNKLLQLYNNFLPMLITPYLVLWGRLTSQEQRIITSLLESDLNRTSIAKKLNVDSGAIGRSLNHLINLVIIEYDNKKYHIIDPLLKSWLINSYERKGLYPYRDITNF